jgi:hypothetical protein
VAKVMYVLYPFLPIFGSKIAIAQNHYQEINGIQRFFLQLDYVIPRNILDLVDDWQYELRQLWTKIPVPPIKLIYDSARIRDIVNCIVYPVCIYYMQRAVYLCAYGESPDLKTEMMRLRAWRPKCEAILPLDLRRSIAADVAEELLFYQQ